ncbi:MAG: hypothetical protein FWF01_01795 [Alphaproteobacteria bacterium]|nr:hypothetical protein [Alphaproteobacteria bacterium]
MKKTLILFLGIACLGLAACHRHHHDAQSKACSEHKMETVCKCPAGKKCDRHCRVYDSAGAGLHLSVSEH